tara:strand:+ start:6442 stop:7383 length:942 start_codon:yes stop_codon:yes gene_type:complete
VQAQRKGKTKSEKHHWWPNCVSQHWKNSEGMVNWLKPDGKVVIAPPKKFGCIKNGHYIKLAKKPGDTTFWDQNFEPIFDNADNHFPSVISWLRSLKRENLSQKKAIIDRFIPQVANDEQIEQLVESIVSLVIRSPMHRETAVSTAEVMRGGTRLPERERNALIAINMRDSHKTAVAEIGTKGKFAVLYSPKSEFIYGDGFFHNLYSPIQPYQLHSFKMLVPITPRISVLYTKPRQYLTDPRLFTMVLRPDETKALNNAVQIYSRQCVFYRNEQPQILSEYTEGVHKVYSDKNNLLELLISSIPGIRSENRFFL